MLVTGQFTQEEFKNLMSTVRRLLDQIEKYRLPNLPTGPGSSSAAAATNDMFSGIGSNSAAKDNEFGFLGGEPTSSVPVTESKPNDPFGNSDPFAASDSKGTNDIFGGISQPKKAAEPDPFGNAFGDSLNLGGSSKPKSKDPFGGWDNDDPVINTQKNDPFGGGSSSS